MGITVSEGTSEAAYWKAKKELDTNEYVTLLSGGTYFPVSGCVTGPAAHFAAAIESGSSASGGRGACPPQNSSYPPTSPEAPEDNTSLPPAPKGTYGGSE